MEPRYNVKVKLVGTNGNAFAIIGRVRSALKKTGATEQDLKEFTTDATSGDYDHVLQTCMKWVDVC